MKELNLVTCIEDLQIIAENKFNTTRAVKSNRLSKDLDLLYKNAQQNIVDQEKAYVYLYRFFKTVEMNDKNYVAVLYGRKLDKIRKQFEQLEADLVRRYSEKQEKEKGNKGPFKKSTFVASLEKFPNDYITAGELYCALQNHNNNILLVDTRPEEDFQKSSIKIGKVINISDNRIQSGLSAHSVGETLPIDYKNIWNLRDTFDIIVLFDWNSTFDNMSSTKLEKLLSALVDWDVNRTYSHKPIILNGGYLEWGQKYPSTCTNPYVVLNQLYSELDELLDLDDIQYPSEENRQPIITFQEIELEIQEPLEMEESREELIRKNKQLSLESELVLNLLIAQEEEWKNMQDEEDLEKRGNIEISIVDLQKELEKLKKQKEAIQEQFELYAKFDPKSENLETNQIKEIADIDKSENQKIMICKTISQQRLDALARARALKPKSSGEPNIPVTPTPSTEATHKGGKAPKPTINRSNKPYSSSPRISLFDGPITFNPEGGGLIGLRNIRNTCYMNTVVQCMRNVPKLAQLFCSGNYINYVRRKPDAIIMETASLFRQLWSNIHNYLNPVSFYEKVCSIEPNYQMGNHEDCMEFFLFLLNNLSEDCAIDTSKRDVMTPVQQAWFNQLGGKASLFTELFYHQLRITQACTKCSKNTYKFEIESTFMLSVPDHDCRVEDLMKNYLQDDIIDDYCCVECKKPVTNSKSVCLAPSILVIVLKRYKQVIRNNNMSLTKLESRISFPTTGFVFNGKSYSLDSIAMHSGTMTSGHYTAACFTNLKWYEFNDEIVRPININEDSVKTKACAFFYSRK